MNEEELQEILAMQRALQQAMLDMQDEF